MMFNMMWREYMEYNSRVKIMKSLKVFCFGSKLSSIGNFYVCVDNELDMSVILLQCLVRWWMFSV